MPSLTVSAAVDTFMQAANAAAMRSACGTIIGTDVLAPTGNGGGLVGMKRTLVFSDRASSGTVATGQRKFLLSFPQAGTITGWRLSSDVATTAVVDIWKANKAAPTIANTITASAKPTLTASAYAESTTLPGWIVSVAAGDVFDISIESNSLAASIALEVDITTT